MARWKARIWLPIHHNLTFSASSYHWGTTRQNMSRHTVIRRGRSLWAKISEGRGRPWGIFFGSYKTRHKFAIWQCKLHRATCRHFDRIPACDRWTDRQTELPQLVQRLQCEHCIAVRCKNQHSTVRTAHVYVHITAYNCHTQHSKKQFW